MDYTCFILIISFFLIALVYSSVGFGGGSSYLALLSQPMIMLLPEVIRPTALLCNIIVVTGGTIIFHKEGKIVWKEIWPFLVASIPMAYVGGIWRLDDDKFFVTLAITLIAASVFLWVQPEKVKPLSGRINSTGFNFFLGGSFGFLSGLVSIGGGIFLSPALHLVRWGEARKISALASVFILVNSISGLAGQLRSGIPSLRWEFVAPLLLAVFVGGQVGSRLGASRFNALYIKRITAVLMMLAAINILRDHW